MGNKILLFILGLAVGAGICAAVLIPKAKRDADTAATTAKAAASASYSSQVADLETALASTKGKLDEVNNSNEKLSTRVQELMKKETALPSTSPEVSAKKNVLAAMFGGEGTNAFSEAMGGMMKTAIQQQMEGKISGMKAKLNLTPEQETALRAIMDKQATKGTEIMEKMFKGEFSEEELKKTSQEGKFSERDEIMALLTPEQQKAYAEYEREEKAGMARLLANSELLQMQSALQLSAEQQDKVFAVLTEQAQTQFDPPKDGGAGALDFEKQADQKKEALRAVLTPEQFQQYEKLQNQQKEMIKAFLPKGGAKANVIVRPTIVK